MTTTRSHVGSGTPRTVLLAIACLLGTWLAAPVAAQDVCGDDASDTCFFPNSTPGCNLSFCCQIVCDADAYCCDVEWDQACVERAIDVCTECGSSDQNDCFTESSTPSCNDAECCVAVCVFEPFCCDVRWDEVCVEEAEITCGGCGGLGTSSCYQPRNFSGCSQEPCCELVCSFDSYCCEVRWDGICAAGAAEACGRCGEPSNNSCFEAGESTGCRDPFCCATVCAADAFCCDEEWDEICATRAEDVCNGCAAEGADSCLRPHDGVGCEDLLCCTEVCDVDPFCCLAEWDAACVRGAQERCLECDAFDGDFNGDGSVNGADLTDLLANWENEGCRDLDSSGTVDGADLTILLSNWTG